ncbi:MAG: MATE family efflux transporter, partial [Oscillospiraceae bacterium]|nr:MATE family efflux transporter [Oscillospiraceae bacterium]
MRASRGDLTTGAISKKLILFALPLLVGSLVQQLYNTVDLIFVGNFIDKSASAAIGASSLLVTCLVGFFGGMSVGSGVVISHIYGARDEKQLSRAIHNTAALCLAGGLALMAAGYALAPVYLRLIRTPENIQVSAVGYLRIYFLSILSVVTYNFGSGALRALGDSKSPLYAQLIGGVMNVAMDYLFIRVFNNGVNGVAWATLISQTSAAAVVVYRLVRLDPSYALRVKKIAFHRDLLKKVISIGVPAGAQSLVITLSNVMVQYHINSFGEDAIAAFTAYFKVELIIYLPIVALGQAAMTFAGQNMGAGNWERVRKGTVRCAVISMALAAVTAAAALPLGARLFRLFNKEPAVIELGRQIIGVTFPFYFLYP